MLPHSVLRLVPPSAKDFAKRLYGSTWQFKWAADRRRLPLAHAQKPMYERIHRTSARMIRRFPDLVACRGYADKIQWLKLFDQRESIIEATDKLRFKELVSRRLGDRFVPRTLQVGRRFDDLQLDRLPSSFVIKTNHDSGSVIVVHDKKSFDSESARVAIDQALQKIYGWETGEWAYWFIEPRVFVEEFLGSASRRPADYKFHCVNGEVSWLQYLYDRGRRAKESLADRRGEPLDTSFSIDFSKGRPFQKPPQWDEMVAIAEQLATGLKYVRVDMFVVEGRIYVGELTFFPGSGFRCRSNEYFGRKLNFDRATPSPPCVTGTELPHDALSPRGDG